MAGSPINPLPLPEFAKVDLRPLVAKIERDIREMLGRMQPFADQFHRSSIAQEVLEEIQRAEAKHGRHAGMPDGTGPDIDPPSISGHFTSAERWAIECKRLTDFHTSQGTCTRLDILLEEVAEAAEQDDLGALRAELVQVAAMAQAWIFDIDGRLEE